jgi:hypothetical protein
MTVGIRGGGARTVAALFAGMIVLAVLAAAGCTRRDSGTPDRAGLRPAAAPSTSAAPTTPAGGAPSDAAPALADGRHPVYLTHLDAPARTLTFDLVQFLTGAQAKQAWARDHPEEPEGPPNDYYIVNDNPKLRTLPVATTVRVKVVDLTGAAGVAMVPIALADLPGYLSHDPVATDNRLWPAPFWLTVQGGQIVAIEEQFVP